MVFWGQLTLCRAGGESPRRRNAKEGGKTHFLPGFAGDSLGLGVGECSSEDFDLEKNEWVKGR